MSTQVSNTRPKPDKVLTDIADYVAGLEGYTYLEGEAAQ